MKIIFILAIALLAGFAQAADITVSHSGGQFSSIQAAINAASPSDTIYVLSGHYHECVTLNKPLNLLGVNTNGTKPTIDASYYLSPITIASNAVNIRGFNVIHSPDNFAGIYGETNQSTIRNVTATENYDGIHLEKSYNNTILNNNVSNNTHNGIILYYKSESNFIENNEVAYQRHTSGYHQHSFGIALDLVCAYNVVKNNIVHDNDIGVGEGDARHDNVLINNTYYNNNNSLATYFTTYS